jgi:uncharacterized protein YukE
MERQYFDGSLEQTEEELCELERKMIFTNNSIAHAKDDETRAKYERLLARQEVEQAALNERWERDLAEKSGAKLPDWQKRIG